MLSFSVTACYRVGASITEIVATENTLRALVCHAFSKQ